MFFGTCDGFMVVLKTPGFMIDNNIVKHLSIILNIRENV